MEHDLPRWFSFARFKPCEPAVYEERLLQLGLPYPDELAALLGRSGLVTLPALWARRQRHQPVCGAFSLELVPLSRDDGATIGWLDSSAVRLHPDGTFGHRGVSAKRLTHHLAPIESRLGAYDDDELIARERPSLEPPSPAEVLAMQRAAGDEWWRHLWRPVFREHPDADVAREILSQIGFATPNRGGSVIDAEDLVHRLPRPALRTWFVAEFRAAKPPQVPALQVALDELEDAADGRPLARTTIERIAHLAWGGTAGEEVTRWARALVCALGQPVAGDLLSALESIEGRRSSPEALARALALARSSQVL